MTLRVPSLFHWITVLVSQYIAERDLVVFHVMKGVYFLSKANSILPFAPQTKDGGLWSLTDVLLVASLLSRSLLLQPTTGCHNSLRTGHASLRHLVTRKIM